MVIERSGVGLRADGWSLRGVVSGWRGSFSFTRASRVATEILSNQATMCTHFTLHMQNKPSFALQWFSLKQMSFEFWFCGQWSAANVTNFTCMANLSRPMECHMKLLKQSIGHKESARTGFAKGKQHAMCWRKTIGQILQHVLIMDNCLITIRKSLGLHIGERKHLYFIFTYTCIHNTDDRQKHTYALWEKRSSKQQLHALLKMVTSVISVASKIVCYSSFWFKTSTFFSNQLSKNSLYTILHQYGGDSVARCSKH